MNAILRPIVETAIRHGANAFGTWLLSTGVVNADQAQTITGAIIIAGSVVWSLSNGMKSTIKK